MEAEPCSYLKTRRLKADLYEIYIRHDGNVIVLTRTAWQLLCHIFDCVLELCLSDLNRRKP